MLLTTVTAFGPGYEHWTFSRPELVDRERELFSTKILSREQHGPKQPAFVDAFVAHAPFYPDKLSITLALWSNQFPTSWKDKLKRLKLLRGREESLHQWTQRNGAASGIRART